MGQFAANDTDGMRKREGVGVNITFESHFMHQPPYDIVSQ